MTQGTQPGAATNLRATLLRLTELEEQRRQLLPVVPMALRPSDKRYGVVFRFGLIHPVHKWSLAGALRRTESGSLAIAELSVAPSEAEEESGVTARLLREIPVGQILAAARLLVQDETLKGQATSLIYPGGVIQPPGLSPRKSHGRPRLDEGLLRDVALAYLEIVNSGQRPVLEILASRFPKPDGTPRYPETMRDWVRAARDRGWLGPARRGVAGADKGPRLIELENLTGRPAQAMQTKRTTKRTGV